LTTCRSARGSIHDVGAFKEPILSLAILINGPARPTARKLYF
jgi:hypothetical protein